MKVYLVEINNMEAYEDYRAWIEKAFASYRGASQWLIDKGFEPYYEKFFGVGDIKFYWQAKDEDDYLYECEKAKIIEMELEEE